MIPGSAPELEVGDVRYWDLNGLTWQLWDVLALLCWMLVAGLVAFGGCWCVGQFMYAAWVRRHPAPRLRFLTERRLRRDLARGLAELEEYLRERDPGHGHAVRPVRPRRSRTWRQPTPRRDRTRTDR